MHGTRPRAELFAPLLSLVTLTVAASLANAQQSARLQPELRVDAIDVRSAREGTLHAGAGVEIPLGYYARLGVVGAGGASRRGDREVGSARADAIARFLLDPFREMSWGLSIGGGLSTGFVAGERWREFVVLVLDIEAPPMSRRIVPTLQLGLGGGARVGIVARRYQQGSR